MNSLNKDSKPIKRRVLINSDNRIAPRPQDYCTVALYGEGTIGFRPNRCRTEYILPLSYVYKIALSREASLTETKRKTHKVNRGLLHTFGVK
jgi:hypothetical protein